MEQFLCTLILFCLELLSDFGALLSSEVEIPIRDDPDYPGDQESLLAADNLSTSIRVRVTVTDFNEPHTVQIQPRDT